MLYKLYIYSLIIFIFSTADISAQSIDFSLKENVIDDKNPTQLILYAEGYPNRDIKLRPVSQKLLVKIYNTKINEWISSGDPWSMMPAISAENKLAVVIPNSTGGLLKFELLLSDGSIVSTDNFIVYSKNFVNNYIEQLNSSVNKTDQDNQLNLQPVKQHSIDENVSNSPLNKIISFVVLYILVTSYIIYLYGVRKTARVPDDKILT